MARFKKEEESNELSLVPILNLVLILIPLLLLSVVFLEITVINVTMPQRSAGAAPPSGEPPKRLQIMISREGFWVIKGDRALPPVPECTGRGGQQVTVCLLEPDAELEVEKYNWLALYNTLIELKADPQWAEHEQVELVAGPDIPFGVLVKAMDVTRYQLVAPDMDDAIKGSSFTSVDEMNSAIAVRVESIDPDSGVSAVRPLGLFPLVVLGLPTTTTQ